jgi:hypothetical protein
MGLLKQIWRLCAPNALDLILARAKRRGQSRFLLCWNRGLGDIPLGIYAVMHRILDWIPEAQVVVLTRPDLKEGFQLLGGVRILVDPTWKRGVPLKVNAALLNEAGCEVILEHPDPTQWCRWQIGKLTPQLSWQSHWDTLSASFDLDPRYTYVGAHVETQTHYGYEKNWPRDSWKQLFESLPRSHRVLLFGFGSKTPFEGENVIDLRGQTTLMELLALIKNHVHTLVLPDSGILSIVYYLNISQPLKVISLWADPKQGVLKQAVPSPNPLLEHRALIAKEKDLSTVSVNQVVEAMQ